MWPFLRRGPGAHSEEGSLLRQEIGALSKQSAALARRVHDLEQREASRESALQRTFRTHRERLDRLDGGPWIQPPATNPLAETLADTPEAAAKLRLRQGETTDVLPLAEAARRGHFGPAADTMPLHVAPQPGQTENDEEVA